MDRADYSAWLASKPKCQRCDEPILQAFDEMNYTAQITTTKWVNQRHTFRFWMIREYPPKQLHTEFTLCNPCANDVMDYAQGKETRNETH